MNSKISSSFLETESVRAEMESVCVGFSVSARTDREGPLPGQQKGQEGREDDLVALMS